VDDRKHARNNAQPSPSLRRRLLPAKPRSAPVTATGQRCREFTPPGKLTRITTKPVNSSDVCASCTSPG